MNRNRLSISSALLSSLLVSVVALGGCSMTPMAPATTAMTARLSGAGEVPSVTSAGIGTADVTLNPSSPISRIVRRPLRSERRPQADANRNSDSV